MIRKRQITIIKIRTKIDIKIKLNQILKGKIKKKYIATKNLRIKFNIINK